MSIAKTYKPKKVEDKWYSHWMEKGYFHSTPDEREPYTIVIPPPNVTGVLHMGHMLNNTLQDVLIRRARMQGFNACWVPGTDHASIATEAKVVQKLAKEGIDKSSLSRDEFLQHAWEWKKKHGGIILEQLKKLGASCDWERTKFTMDEDMSAAVINVFVDLHKKGLIYRGIRMVNWDPAAQTALSDEEVIHKEVNSKLYHIAYDIEGSDEKLTIATTRPETILGDSAICVNPNDEQYKHLKGAKAIVPLIGRNIPVIFDEYVDMEFGTGALKITPAHDINDYQLGDKHSLETIDILNDDGTLSEAAQLYVGQDRFEVRKQIVKDLDAKGFLVKMEDYQNKVGFSERTDAVIEPKLSMQWFFKMGEFSKPALDNVMNDNIHFHPAKFKNTYRHWMENIKDWCVSRQLWWGQRIPAYFYDGNKYVVAETAADALKLAQAEKPGVSMEDLRQDEDVLDTWFSSWLWPISVFDGIKNPDNEEINYYYPTNDLVTAPEILFFWVARMIMAGYEYIGDMPFKNVYLTGIVRDKQGRKMSKSLGNSPDPIELMDKYGADGVRVGMLLCSPAGNDLPFDEALCEQGRNFSNKIWNAFRLIKGWEAADIAQPESAKVAIEWFQQKLNKTITEIDASYSQYRISEALMSTYKLVWDDFCSWYLEMVKPAYQQPIDQVTLTTTIEFLEDLLKLLHPFMPFLTEEVWHAIKERTDDIIVTDWPQTNTINNQVLTDFEVAAEVISGIRNIRKQKNIANKEVLDFSVKINASLNTAFDAVIAKLGNLSSINYVDEKIEEAFSFLVKSNEYFIPLGSASIDVEAEIDKLQKELDYTKGFLKSVEGKLKNERFVNNAPEQVVVIERKKQADALSKITVLEEQIAALS
ncbi:MAG: valine--tRNA ligase [Flavobacteriales bacterium]|nr:valine--tRNA ligase [Flavobacteriales bacterium]